MSHRKPTKEFFNDDWKLDALCAQVYKESPHLKTAWDNIDYGDYYGPDPQEDIAKTLCDSCKERENCLKDAIADNEADGIRAGYRFENGMVTQPVANMIWREEHLRARVRKKAVQYVDTEEVSEVRENEGA